MTIEFTIVAIAISLIYALITKFLPDFPVAPEVFQVVILYLLAKIGIEVVGKPLANKYRVMRGIKPLK